MNSNLLGKYIFEMRKGHSVGCSDLAKKINITTAYLSQLERGFRSHPDPQVIKNISKVLDLSLKEKYTLFDLYAETTGNLPPDITEYLNGNSAVQRALRQAREANATEEDWERFIEQLKK